MVVKKSEYQNQFKPSVITKNQSVYLENLTFRHERRDKEFVHTPLGWQDQHGEDISSSDEEVNENSNCHINSKAERKNDEPQYQSLAEILDESKAKSKAFRQQKREDTHSKDALGFSLLEKMSSEDKSDPCLLNNKDLAEKSETIDDNVKVASKEDCDINKFLKEDTVIGNTGDISGKTTHENKLKNSRSNLRSKGTRTKKTPINYDDQMSSAPHQKSKSCAAQQAATCHVPSLAIGHRPKRPDRQKRIPSAKCRPVSQERPPFLAYGAGDIENTFTTHRTHNVRSAVDVYGPALKAKIRREEEKKRQLEKQKRLTQSTNDLLEKLASATPRDMCDWRSEYQKQFHGYEPKMYERSSSRAVISHSVPIRAVHRGGGLIVHVD